jgi:hypothetical protein
MTYEEYLVKHERNMAIMKKDLDQSINNILKINAESEKINKSTDELLDDLNKSLDALLMD